MQALIERLQSEGVVLDDAVQSELKALWKWGIDRIEEDKLRGSVAKFYREIVPWQFFVEPSSPSGRHHPSHHNRPGGIVRHLTECCIMADKLLVSYGFFRKIDHREVIDTTARDVVLAATVLSDACKNGYPWGPKTLSNHGEIVAELWEPLAWNGGVNANTMRQVYEAVYWHYGRFTPAPVARELQAMPVLTQIVHLLDAISSADEIGQLYTALPEIE